MALLNLPPCEDNVALKRPSVDVAYVDITNPDMIQFVKDMKETMKHWPAVGLAAVQVEKPIKVILVVDNNGEVYPLFNAKITHYSKTKEKLLEGCLSIPGITVEVDRPVGVTVEYIDETGKSITKKVAGLEAKILQHEIDHTEGVLITDHGAPYKRHNIG